MRKGVSPRPFYNEAYCPKQIESRSICIDGDTGTLLREWQYIYDKYGYHILDATLRLTLATWESETNSLSANFLKAIARIIAVFGDSLREDIFKEHVGRCSVKSIIRTAKERRPGVLGYAEAMLIAYNAKNKYRLPIKKLYGSQRDEELDDEETDDDSAAI